jgi:hypothetical protein
MADREYAEGIIIGLESTKFGFAPEGVLAAPKEQIATSRRRTA